MTTVDEKECLLNLPLKERTVALALKNIFDKIKQFEDEENVEVQKIHQSFIARFKEIEQNVNYHSRRPLKLSMALPSRLNTSKTLIISSPRVRRRRWGSCQRITKESLPIG